MMTVLLSAPADAEIKRVPFAAAEAEAAEPEKENAKDGPGADLDERGQGDGAARADDFFQIDLEPDHEEEKNEPELGDGGNAFGAIRSSPSPAGPRAKPRDEIGEQDRLPKLLRDQPEQPGGGNAKSDVANEFVHER